MVFLNQRWKDTADNTQKTESHPSEGEKKKKSTNRIVEDSLTRSKQN